MQNEVADFFSATPALHNPGGGIVIDATVGFGGHLRRLLDIVNSLGGDFSSSEVLIADNKVRAHAIDADAHMLASAKEKLHSYGNAIKYYNKFFDNYFVNAPNESADFILMDLGLSMYHFKESGRGFSRSEDAPLDMRLSSDAKLQATDIINTYTADQLVGILYEYGEERQAVKWVNRIIAARKTQHIATVTQFCEALQLGKKAEDRAVLTRIFQALRIEVNDELGRIQRVLPQAWRVLKPGGRIAIISFHSLEDRIVKHFFKFLGGTLKIAENTPINIDTHYLAQYNTGTILTKKPVTASVEELQENNASRSAKLRVVEKKYEKIGNSSSLMYDGVAH